MTSFRAAVKRSVSSFSRQESTFSRQESTFSRQQSHEDRPSYFRQASTRSNPDPFALTDKLSRFSLEELPISAHPSPFPGREGFPTLGAEATYDDDEDDEVSEEAKVTDSVVHGIAS